MIRGVSGRLISASYARDLLVSLPCYTAPPSSVLHLLDRWSEQVDSTLGPTSTARAIADVCVAPLLRILELPVVARHDEPDVSLLDTGHGDRRGPRVIVVGWDQSLGAGWRRAVLNAIQADHRWAFCSNGTALRVVDAHRTWSREHLELDLRLVSSEAAAAIAWTFLRGSSITSHDPPLDRAAAQSERYSTDICRGLGRGVLDALEVLLEALKQRKSASRTSARRADASQPIDEALTVMYRVLFLLFAEARGLVPVWHPVYRNRYSLDAIVTELLEGRRYRGLWTAIQAISRLAHAGYASGELQVNAFNGRLFSASATATFEKRPLTDSAMLHVMTALSSATVSRAGRRQRIIYRDLDVEQLGAVYERLLEYEPSAVPLERSGDLRKASGSFYTPRDVTSFLVRRTLEPLVAGRSSAEILSLRVLDPAMGSGAFLVATCRYLAARAEDALIEEGQWHPGEVTHTDRVGLRREIALRCLYGVDLNPTAVHLARLSVWLATLASDKPLSFLDHCLVAGDSLLGATPQDVHRRTSGASRREQREDHPLFAGLQPETALETAVRVRHRLALEADVSAAVVRDKTRALASLTTDDAPLRKWVRLLDLWCAGWFWDGAVPLTRSMMGELSDFILRGQSALPASATAPLLAQAAGIASSRRFLHWPLTFPEVLVDESGAPLVNAGFDAIIGNPPWDMIRGDSGGDTVRAQRRDDARRLTRFVRGSGVYRFESQAHINRYQLFVERSLQLARRGGRIGFVLPSGIASDTASSALRRQIFERANVDSLTGLDNRHGIFAIHRSVRFALLTCTTGEPTREMTCRFGVSNADDLESPVQPIVISQALLSRISGSDDLGIPEVTSALDLRIVEGASTRFRWISAPDGWNARFGRELNATDDRHRFAVIDSDRRRTDERVVLEGKNLEPFSVALETCRFRLRESEEMPASARQPRLAYRDVASATNRLTLIAAIVPAHVVTTHTLFCLKTPLAQDEQRVLCGLLNSFVANFLIRLRVHTHVSASLISRLPVPVVRRDHPLFRRLLSVTRVLLESPSPAESLPEYAQLQALVADLYQLNAEEFTRVLETFPLVDKGVRKDCFHQYSTYRQSQKNDTEAPRHRE